MKVLKINLGGENPSPSSGRFWTKALVMALAIFITSFLLPFIKVETPISAIIAAVVISLLNAFLKPLLMLISAPLIMMSFGLFQLIINAFIVLLTSNFVNGFEVSSFIDAVWFSIVVTIVSFLLDLPAKIKRVKQSFSPFEKEQIKEEDCFTEYQEVDSEQEDNDNKDK
ncbi:MAG: phage holin family protein [Bacteroidales bacterium]|nr:phage holin family protein [Bacteroidales bacterium]